MSYARFGLTLLVSFTVMFVLSLAQINVLGDFFLNLSNFYVSLLMVSAMGVIMLVAMWRMFANRRLNVAFLAVFVLVFVGAFYAARTETFVGDKAFLQSMIPHHSRAILVCQQSQLTDPQIVELCRGIVESQQSEIDEMKQILQRY